MVVGLLGNKSSYSNRLILVFQSLRMMYDYKLNLAVRTSGLVHGSSQNIKVYVVSKGYIGGILMTFMRKYKKIIGSIIAVVLVVAMLVPMFLQF